MFWYLGGMRLEIKEYADAATGVADGREGGVGVDTETHVTGDVPNDGVGEWGNEIKDFFVAATVSSISLAWSETIYMRAGRRGLSISRA